MTSVTEPASSAKMADFDPVPAVCRELGLPAGGVRAVVALLAEGSTVPFIARYRKEATGGLDEVAIRNIDERRSYLLELEARRASVLAEIRSQGKLTPALEARLRAAPTKAWHRAVFGPMRPGAELSTMKGWVNTASMPRLTSTIHSSVLSDPTRNAKPPKGSARRRCRGDPRQSGSRWADP